MTTLDSKRGSLDTNGANLVGVSIVFRENGIIYKFLMFLGPVEGESRRLFPSMVGEKSMGIPFWKQFHGFVMTFWSRNVVHVSKMNLHDFQSEK